MSEVVVEGSGEVTHVAGVLCEYHLTQAELARSLGVSESAVALWRNGRRRCPHTPAALREAAARAAHAAPWRAVLRAGEPQVTPLELRLWRARAGYTVQACARVAGVDRNRWMRWEQEGAVVPFSAAALERLMGRREGV